MSFSPSTIYLIPALPLLGFIINSFFVLLSHKTKTKLNESIVAGIACAMPISAFVLAILAFLNIKANAGAPIASGALFSWMPTALFEVDFGFVIDPLSSVMLLIITGVGSLIHLYSIGYMKGDASFGRFFSYLNLFLFFMLLLVLGDNLLVLFVGWEGVGLCSYLLIGFWFSDAEKASAGKKAFVVNRIGDFGFLVGLFFILYAFTSQVQSSDLSFFDFTFLKTHQDIFSSPIWVDCSITFAEAIAFCLFIGATGKSAQIPLYVWLPDAMAGPTPVSALIHAATMVTAGVYMVARLFFIYNLAPIVLDMIAVIGVATALMAALIAITQYDIKKVLAYSTVSQLGYMFLALGVGAPSTAIFHVMTHAFFKACLFLGAGSVIHALHHQQDIRHMGGLFKKMPITAVAFGLSCLAIAGIPPFSGFFSKDEILFNTYLHASPVLYGLAVLTAGMTAFYMFRLFVYVFLGSSRGRSAHALPMVMELPVAVLAGLAVVGGFVGVPEVLGGSNPFYHWLSYLAPAAHHAVDHSLELKLMAGSTLWAVLMSGLAVWLYTQNLYWTKSLKAALAKLHNLMSNKFYIDEIYEALIIKPLIWISKNSLWKGSDQKIVDGLMVHGWSDLALFGSRMVRALQTGFLGHYLIYLCLGLVFVLAIMMI